MTTVPIPEAGRAPRLPRVARRTLDNGLEVVAARRSGIPMAEMRLRLPAPARTAADDARRRLLTATLLAGTEGYDAVALAARLQELGGKLLMPVTDAGDIGRFTLVQDPQGAMFAVHSRKAG